MMFFSLLIRQRPCMHPCLAPVPRQVALLGEKSEKMRHHSFTRSVPASRVAGA